MAWSAPSGLTTDYGRETLLTALSKHKKLEDLEQVPEKIWLGDVVERLKPLHSWRDDPSLVTESKAALQSLRKAGAFLAYLNDSLWEAFRSLESTLLPFEYGRGLANLPDSILSTILELVCVQYTPKRSGRFPQTDLNRVSRRFRDIVSRSPRLWCSVSGYFDKKPLKTFLEKSRCAGLELKLGEEWFSSTKTFAQVLRSLPELLAHSGRIEDLKLDCLQITQREYADLSKFLIGLHLPRLHSLSISYSSAIQRPSPHFYSLWELGKLRSFSIRGDVPDYFNAPLLTSLTVTLLMDFDYGKLFDCLSANLALEDLRLHVLECRGHGRSTFNDIVFENVKTLELKLSTTPFKAFHRFRSALCTPNVREISLTCQGILGGDSDSESEDDSVDEDDDSYQENDPGEIVNLLLCHKTYPHLESLSYTNLDRDESYTIPFSNMPSLRFLRLNTPYSCPDDIGLYAALPIRGLRIYWHSNMDWLWWMEALHERMLEQDKMSGFEMFVIRNDATPIAYVRKMLMSNNNPWDGCWRRRNWDSEGSDFRIRLLR